jgi:hypothetical protein
MGVPFTKNAQPFLLEAPRHAIKLSVVPRVITAWVGTRISEPPNDGDLLTPSGTHEADFAPSISGGPPDELLDTPTCHPNFLAASQDSALMHFFSALRLSIRELQNFTRPGPPDFKC